MVLLDLAKNASHDAMMRRLSRLCLALLGSFLAIYPLALGYRISGIKAAFEFFAGDTFYYLAVAKNSSAQTFFSYDTIHPTNGFHPLWQYFLRFCVANIGALHADQQAQILFVYVVGAVLVGIAAAFLVTAFRRIAGSATLSLFGVVPGFFHLAFSFTDRNYGSLWSFANGMESPLSLCFFSIFLFLASRRPPRRLSSAKFAFLLSILLSFVVLSRLDDVFLIPATALAMLWDRNRARRWRDATVLCALPLVLVVLYCAFNKYYAGTLLPISGVVKNGFALKGNLGHLVYTVYPKFPIRQRSWFLWNEGTWRILQLIVPMLAAGATLLIQGVRWWKRSQAPGRRASLLISLCVYVVLKGGYNLAFVGLFAQGHWYFPISISIFNLLTALFIRDILQGRSREKPIGLAFARSNSIAGIPPRIIKPAVFLVAVVMSICLANSLLATKDSAGAGVGYSFWTKRHQINDQMPNYYSGTGILEFEDGMIAYALYKPVMSGMGYTLDREAAKAKQSGKLLSLAYDRGFRMIGTVYYTCPLPNEPGLNVNAYLDGHVFWLTADDLKAWQFILRYHDPESGCAFIEFKPR